MSVAHAQFVSVLRVEGERIAAMPADMLTAAVPSCPGWTLEHVVRHVGRVHSWATAVLQSEPSTPIGDIRPKSRMSHGPDCLTEYRTVLDGLLTEFAHLDPATPRPAFVGSGTVGWWARRQAHETTVHRIDAADAVHAAGGPEPDPLDPAVAADGVDEWLSFALARIVGDPGAPGTVGVPDELRGRTVHVHGTDTPDAEWSITFTEDGVRVTGEHTKGDVALRGPAADLLLTLWNRRPLESVRVFGDATIARAMLDAVRV
ncbi:maleylpyruvate isomerase family mycothiol-dependent enzyme [Rhodococcus chondri]|uniref:Maleylpyruvate isomerase family mycothiol-dependent enzyme n=1 Tax=Rhodococcus chondri TaxID=3065941 RepID=A0ABU7JNL3_9NOCA|nr:maleylpyruvate isomerase family mycothiol-dependent enzyme [Rhodococcus sp. CC-R104]MEE2031312.1 maleylpyruvate isomerase family mycothiol-dependent enzyme [Rhodococcus sp. CC-R104]